MAKEKTEAKIIVSTPPPQPTEQWQAAVLRLTAFPAEAVRTEQLSWWTDVVGYPAEAVTSRPKLGQYQAEGEFEGRSVSLQVQPVRIDWQLNPVIKVSDEEPTTLPLAGPFPEALGSFMKIAHAWLPLSPAITRLAFGVVLAQPVEDRRAGYVEIAKYLHNVRLDPDGSSDLLFQINRPRPSKVGVEGLRINRLGKWSVLLFQRVGVTLGKTQLTTVGLGPGDSACRLELDINTVPDFKGTLPADKLPAILRELVDLGVEIAEQGDIP